MSRRKMGDNRTVPEAANDNTPPEGPVVRTVEVLLPKNMPILQVEVEVFVALLDDWPVANDNEEP